MIDFRKAKPGAVGAAVVLGLVFWFGSNLFQSVPPGQVGVATFFGKVQEKPFAEGLHFPVNPFYEWHTFDIRQKSHKETAQVPSRDQLLTKIDVSIQYRLIGSRAPNILRETGTPEQVVDVHLVPKLRSLIREAGKTVEKAEDFFRDETQSQLEIRILEGLRAYLEPMGVNVHAVLLRDITLPAFITQAIEAKKEREQAAERQKAELTRFRTEQEQKIAQAQAERQAAEEDSRKRRILADAQAYEIEKINAAIAGNPLYVQLMALEALKAISKDPAAKVYFMNGDAPYPLPLMHMGEVGPGFAPAAGGAVSRK
jgi:regulator of protease activity HflC (stomatin/prohibitin superfamily)